MAQRLPRSALFLLLIQVQKLLLLACSFVHSSAGANVNNITSAAAPSVPCLPDQAAALLQLRRSFLITKKSTKTFQSWRAGTDCCRWDGVGCGHGNGRVTSLDLGACDLQSAALDPAIFSLTSLRYLNLAYNDFNASGLPSVGFERITKLTHLNLSNCNFAGRIPTIIGRLTNLILLDLSTAFEIRDLGDYGYQNVVKSTSRLVVPNFAVLIANLTYLRELRLDATDISSSGAEWCDAVAKYTPNLRVLTLPFCFLSGRICGLFSRLHSLVALDLQRNKLYGPVPDFFANFPSLRVLQLRFNLFEGWFPSIVLQKTNLVTVDLSHNEAISGILPNFSTGSSLENFLVRRTNFSGKIPSSISNLKSLKKLDLAATGFSGKIPSSIGLLKSLDLLAFSGFELVGSIPSWITNMSSLTVLHFSRCGLSGSIPYFVGNLRGLKELTLSHCQFYGNIPSFISNLTQLDTLNLESNNLVGRVEISMFWKLPYLYVLILSNNKLHVVDREDDSSLVYPGINFLGLASCNIIGRFPKVLRHFDKIKSLDLSHNQIGGAIPQWALESFSGRAFFILNLSHNNLTNVGFVLFRPLYVFQFDLSFNLFEGPIPLPQEFGRVLDYSNNMFSSVPLNISTQLQKTVVFKASTNNLLGGISESFCTPVLRILDLSYNNLSGSIPSCLMEDTNALQVLNLKRNKLRGELPHNVNESCTLQALQLGDNCIKGQLPTSLAACKNLQVLDIGNNQISGYFPCWISILAGLQVLVLKSNRFFGHMEHYIAEDINSCEFSSLRILDIASNNFSGSLQEKWFTRLNSMIVKTANEAMMMEYTDASRALDALDRVYQVATIITYKGFEVSISNILGSLVFIDMSNNAFGGSIPDAIGELVLLNMLNLSHNTFMGPIPSLLGHLKLLEALDMSSNELSGEIPQELALLDFLSILNLSYNNLVGRIPEPPHFTTFTNSSFLGNDGLCGPPLSKKCINTTTSSVVAHHSKNKPVDIVLFLFVGLGFGVGFAVAVVVTWGIPIRKQS